MKVIGYTRRSKGEAQSTFSHDIQERYIRDFCETEGLKLTRIVKEDDRGTKDEFDRPLLREVLDQVSDPDIHGLVVWRIDRLVRGFRLSQYYAEMLSRQGKRIYSVSEKGWGLSLQEALAEGYTENEYMQMTMINAVSALFGEIEHVVSVIRIEEGKQEAIRKGRAPFKVPVGYYRDKEGNIHIAPPKARWVQQLFHQFLTLQSVSKVAKLNEIPLGSLEHILQNPFYIGMFRWRGEIYQGIHPPTVKPEIWEKVQAIFKAKKKKVTK